MSHTPGPWRIGDAGCTVFGPPNGNPSPSTVATITRNVAPTIQQRANARLISAAPELLAACKMAVSVFNLMATKEGEEPLDPIVPFLAVERLLAIIEKAEGGAS